MRAATKCIGGAIGGEVTAQLGETSATNLRCHPVLFLALGLAGIGKNTLQKLD